jgi:hypothetical protein
MDGYFDESGEHNDSGALTRLTLGGFFAPWSEIERLGVKWREALDDEGLAEFHMKEIASDEHDYPNWPGERQRRLDRFVDILCEHAGEFGAFSYVPANPARPFPDAYEPALARVLIIAASLSERTKERGNVVFAQTDEIKSELIGRYFDSLHWYDELDGYSVLRSRDCPALQAAEIVARGLKRVMQDGGITQSFSRVLTAGKPISLWPFEPFATLSVSPRFLGVAKL